MISEVYYEHKLVNLHPNVKNSKLKDLYHKHQSGEVITNPYSKGD